MRLTELVPSRDSGHRRAPCPKPRSGRWDHAASKRSTVSGRTRAGKHVQAVDGPCTAVAAETSSWAAARAEPIIHTKRQPTVTAVRAHRARLASRVQDALARGCGGREAEHTCESIDARRAGGSAVRPKCRYRIAAASGRIEEAEASEVGAAEHVPDTVLSRHALTVCLARIAHITTTAHAHRARAVAAAAAVGATARGLGVARALHAHAPSLVAHGRGAQV